MKKRILAMLLAAALVISGMPAIVSAADTLAISVYETA